MTAKAYGKLEMHGDRWLMTGIPPHVAIRLKATFPRINKSESAAFTFHDTPEVSADLDWFLNRYPMTMSADDKSRLKGGRGAFEKQRDEIETIMLPEWTPQERSGFRPGFAMYQMQSQAVEIAERLGRLLVMDDVGLGKTVVGLGLLTNPANLPGAVIAPSHLPTQWVNDFIKPFTGQMSHIIKGTKPYSLPRADIYLFKESNICGWVDIASTGMFKTAIFDEMQGFRHGVSTVKGQAARVFANNAKLRVGLTATPVYNYGSEIFNIIELIAPGVLGDWNEFVREWCTGRDGKWVVKDPDALGTYLRELQLVVRRLRQGRPINTLTIEVQHDEQVEQDSLALARTLAGRVMSGSFVERGQAARELDAFARMVTGVSKARSVAAYVRIMLKAGKPVVLAGWHRDVYEIWLKELAEFKPVLYTGSESTTQKDAAKEAFIKGDTDLFIISLRSGVGLDGLQKRCSTVIIGELDWSPKVHEQIIGRLDRPGQQEDEVTAIYLFTNSGSDPTVMGVLGLKASQSKGIVDPMSGVVTVHSDESRIKKLAQSYLQQSGAA